MRKSAEYILKVRPWSPSAFLAALLVIALAAGMQEVLASFGTRLCFAAFFPAILVASLLGGAPAGAFAVVVTRSRLSGGHSCRPTSNSIP